MKNVTLREAKNGFIVTVTEPRTNDGMARGDELYYNPGYQHIDHVASSVAEVLSIVGDYLNDKQQPTK